MSCIHTLHSKADVTKVKKATFHRIQNDLYLRNCPENQSQLVMIFQLALL